MLCQVHYTYCSNITILTVSRNASLEQNLGFDFVTILTDGDCKFNVRLLVFAIYLDCEMSVKNG
jgi:hypothetical protein